jgi:DNA polymerase-1
VSGYEAFNRTKNPIAWLDFVFREATTLIGHNIIGYDLPLLKRLYGWTPGPDVRIIDTLILSRLLDPDRGSHSLDAWGERLGYSKGEYSDWSRYTPEMLSYCQRDVEVTRRLYAHLLKEMGDWDWTKAIELEHKYATIMQEQEENGVCFDLGSAHALRNQLTGEINEIESNCNLPGRYVKAGAEVSRPFKINGELTKRAIRYTEPDSRHISGPFSPVNYQPLNMGSEKQIKDYLLDHGWVPTQWNYVDGEKTSPKISEDSFGTIQGDFGQRIKRRKICSHRLSQLQGWLNNVRPDGRISAAANTIGTPTGRCRHRIVVNVPAKRAAFGLEMRSLFTVPPGYVMVGHDAEQIELRMLAHYMGDAKFIQEILSGDVHTYNQELAGLSTRDAAKSFIYAFIYGAGNEKLGSLAGGGSRKGGALRRKFLQGLPALKRLITRAKYAAERGYLKGLDGRKIILRRDENGRVLTHKALNSLLQCADAVVMKQSVIFLDEAAKKRGLDYMKVIDMHDEGEAQVIEHQANEYAALAEWSIKAAGEYFNLNIPMDATATIGKNWYEVH